MVRYRFLPFLALLLAGCGSAPPVRPMQGRADTEQLTGEEQRVWYSAGELDDQMRKADYLYEDAALQAYVQQVMNKLYPEYRGAIRVQVADSPSLNAFALPNGSIYINTGLLARLDNEAQMATVLAHEGVHFTRKHSLQQRRNTKSSTAFSTTFGMVTGIPLLGELMAASSIYGFSKDLEREADAEGFKRLREAGYDVSQAPVTFEFLLAEVEALDIDEPYFFSTHPGLQERIDSFRQLAAPYASAGGYRGEEAYQAHVGALREHLLADYLGLGQFQSVLLILTREDAFTRYPPAAWYYLGEAYRMRGQEGDADRAAEAYRTALARAPGFAPTYRALGLQSMKSGESKAAARYFTRYLELAPAAPDRAYIEMYRSQVTP